MFPITVKNKVVEFVPIGSDFSSAVKLLHQPSWLTVEVLFQKCGKKT